MIVEYIRYKIKKTAAVQFIEAYRKAAEELDASEFCLGYELAQCEEEPENFILRIEWTSTDEHLNGFRKSPGFRNFFGHIRFFFDNIEEMNHYKLTAVKGKNIV